MVISGSRKTVSWPKTAIWEMTSPDPEIICRPRDNFLDSDFGGVSGDFTFPSGPSYGDFALGSPTDPPPHMFRTDAAGMHPISPVNLFIYWIAICSGSLLAAITQFEGRPLDQVG